MVTNSGFQIFQAGYRLGCLEHIARDHDAESRAFNSINRTLSQVALRSFRSFDAKQRESGIQTDEYFLGRIALGLLQRGMTSFASPDVERTLISQAYSSNWEEWTGDDTKCPEGEIRFGLRNPGELKLEAMSGFGVLALTLFDSRAEANWSREFGSTPEAWFYRTHLATLLGAGLALTEAQRPISSMIDPQQVELEEFAEQRVDFAVESPTGAKIVFEIDGGQHDEQRQKDLDRRRDNALRRSGWHIERIKLIQARFDHHEFSKETVARIEKDDVLSSLQHMQAIERNLTWAEADILGFVLTSHAIARAQLACLLAMINGDLTLDAPEWNIAVIERDSRCSSLALSDLASQLHHLANIYGIRQLPPINLAILDQTDGSKDEVGAEFALPEGFTIDAGYVERDEFVQQITQADLVIDVAVRARQSDEFQDHGLTKTVGDISKSFVEIRTAYRGAPEQFIPWSEVRPIAYDANPSQALAYFLKSVFRKTKFRELQENVVIRALARKSLIGLLPTGSGKSVTFQLPTLLSPGVSIVICPLKSLMDDQVVNLSKFGIDRATQLRSGMDQQKRQEAIDSFVSGFHRMLYVSPERFQQARFRSDLASSAVASAVSFIVVDEAHCVSEWGHDFRPAYLNVGRLARQLCSGPRGEPPILAVTGTASQNVLSDIQRELDIELGDADAVISAEGFNRKNLEYLVLEGPPEKKRDLLSAVFEEISSRLGTTVDKLLDDGSEAGLVFCRNVNGKFGVDEVSSFLRSSLQIDASKITRYSGKKPDSFTGSVSDWEKTKESIQTMFKRNMFPLLTTTSSFGMGIDKENIRYTINYGIPDSIEALAQESGRAGRDLAKSICAVIYTPEPSIAALEFLNQELGAEEAYKRIPQSRQYQGDVAVLAYLHHLSYRDRDDDVKLLQDVASVIIAAWEFDSIGLGEILYCSVPFPAGDQEITNIEKAIYRLTILGLVIDYTKDFSSRRFDLTTVRISQDIAEIKLRDYVLKYDPEDIANAVVDGARSQRRTSEVEQFDHVIDHLVQFLYERIEKDRRRAIENLVLAINEADGDGDKFQQLICNHLAKNSFSGQLANLSRGGNEIDWWSVLDEVRTPEDITQVLAAARRTLESSAEHPGVLTVVGIAGLRVPKPDAVRSAEYLGTALRVLTESYQWNKPRVASYVETLLQRCFSANPDSFDDLVVSLIRRGHLDLIARPALSRVRTEKARRMCTVPWLREVGAISRSMRVEHIGKVN